MNKLAFLLVCLLFDTEGRRVQSWIQRLQTDPCAASQNSLSEVVQPDIPKVLSKFTAHLPKLQSAAAFNSPSLGARAGARSSAHASSSHAGRHGQVVPVMDFYLEDFDDYSDDERVDLSDEQFAEIQKAALASLEELKNQYELERSMNGPEHPTTVILMCQYVNTAVALGEVTDTPSLMKEAVELSRKTMGAANPERLLILETFAGVLNANGLALEAEPLQKELLELRQETLGREHGDTLRSLAQYAITLGRLGNFAEAEPFMKESMAESQRLLGPADPETILRYRLYQDVFGPEAEAEAAQRAGLQSFEEELEKRVNADGKPKGLAALLRKPLKALGKIRQKFARRDEPEVVEFVVPEAVTLRMLERMLRVYELECRTSGPEHQSTVTAMSNCAIMMQKVGRHEEAETMMKTALERSCRFLGRSHPISMGILENYADARFFNGSFAEAKSWSKELLSVRRDFLGPAHPATFRALDKYIATLDKLGSRSEAMQEIEEAAKFGYTPPEQSAEAKDQDVKATLESLKNVLTLENMTYGLEHPGTIQALSKYALALETSGRHVEAEPLITQALELSRRVLGPEHPDTIKALSEFAAALVAQGHTAEAKLLNKEAFEIMRRVLGPEHPDTIAALSKYKNTMPLKRSYMRRLLGRLFRTSRTTD